MDLNNTVSLNVKRIREEKKLTLDAAAAMTGVSRSMLAQIEKGDVNPTISVLWKIAVGYKVSFTSLIDKGEDSITIVRHSDTAPLYEGDDKYVIYPTFSFDESKLFESYVVEIKSGGELSAQPHLKGSQEYITVFSGEVEISVGNEKYLLREGDSIRFFADVPHEYRNKGDKIIKLNMLIYYGR